MGSADTPCMITFLSIFIGTVAATGVLGLLGLRFGTDSRPGFDERPEPMFGHGRARQIPGV